MARTKGAKNKTAGQIAKEAAAKLQKQSKKLSPEQKKEAQEAIKELGDIKGGEDEPGQHDDTAGQDGASGDSEPGTPTIDGSSTNGDANTSDGSEIRESGDAQKPLEGVPQGTEDSGPADRGETAPGDEEAASTIPEQIKPTELGGIMEDSPDWAPTCQDGQESQSPGDSANNEPRQRGLRVSRGGKKFLGRHPITKGDVWR